MARASRVDRAAQPQAGPEPEAPAAVDDLHRVPRGSAAGETRALDRLIHERVRLGIVSALAVNDKLSFIELRKLLDTTDGNLSVHARRLEDGGYIRCTKSFEGRQPKTEYQLTKAGRQALESYVTHMEAVIASVKRG